MYETIGSGFGIAAPTNLWAQAIDDPFSSITKLTYSDKAKKRKRSCGQKIVQYWHRVEQNLSGGMHATAEAFYVDVAGLSDDNKGRSVMRKLVLGGVGTQDAFAGPAMRVIVSFKWDHIGKPYFMFKAALYFIYLTLQTYSAAKERQNTRTSYAPALAVSLCAPP